jgi:putative acetyltransferase
MSDPLTLLSVESQEQSADVRELFLEYAAAIGVDLEYQGFTAELAALPLPYVPPHGALLIARINEEMAGCVALRRIDGQTGEMKRLYVRPAFRSWGLGRHLIGEIIQVARRAGYTTLRLDTLPSMEAAQGPYRSLGFSEIPAYNNTHLPGTRFYELRLAV